MARRTALASIYPGLDGDGEGTCLFNTTFCVSMPWSSYDHQSHKRAGLAARTGKGFACLGLLQQIE